MSELLSEFLLKARDADEKNRPAAAVEYFAAARRKGEALPVWAEFRFADNLRAIGRLKDAEELLCRLTVPEKKAWLLSLHLGQVAYDSGNLQAAVDHFATAVEKNPRSTVPYVHLAATYSKTQQYDKAIEILSNGLQAEGDRDEIYLNLGYTHRALGQYSAAKEAFSRALEITPGYSEAFAGLQDVASIID
jgi:protein O-GlcNAc transferase